MTTVAEEGNRRVGDMTEDEMEQCAGDVKSWFERKSDLSVTGARSTDFQMLRKGIDACVPESLITFLSVINGSIWFMDKQALSVERIIEVYTEMTTSKKWDENYIPFCGEEDSMLVVNAADSGVYEWDADDGLGDNVAASFASYLEDYSNALLGGQMEYLSGCGVVEKMGAGGKSRK